MRFEAIVICPGPSLHSFLRMPRDYDVKLIGCSRVTNYVNDLDYYVYADSTHKDKLPSRTFHPKCQVYSVPRLYVPQTQWHKWDDSIPHGGNSGGMAISLGCLKFNSIGLVGLDGHGLPENWVIEMGRLLSYWQERGKYLYTLMGDSIFNNRLLKP